eukprot:scaffold18270_cov33-Tisochrysis_lutea.AAC.2
MAKLPGKQGEPERKRKNASAAEAGSQGRRGQSRRKSAASVAKGPEKRKNRPAADAERSAAETSADEAREEARSGGKRVACTLFVGQLPFSVTADDIKAHFLSVCEPPISVRLLTDKKSGKSRGMAFVEMGSESAVHTALRLHHSCICGRRINVERTVGGGHSGEARVNRLKELRDKQVGASTPGPILASGSERPLPHPHMFTFKTAQKILICVQRSQHHARSSAIIICASPKA